MPKAFLLKYKKRCEYFGSRSSSDGLEGCESPIKAVYLKKMETDLDEKKDISGKSILLILDMIGLMVFRNARNYTILKYIID